MFTPKFTSPPPRGHKAALCRLGLLCVLGVTPQYAQAQATYSAEISATLKVLPFNPPLGPNTFGFAEFTGQTAEGSNTNPDPPAINSATKLSSAALVRPGIGGLSSAAGNAEGQPFFPAHAASFAKTISKINLGNFTGGPGPTPPPQNLTFQLQLTYTYTISASATTMDDQARAHIFLSVDAADVPFMVDASIAIIPGPGMNSATGSGTIMLPDTVPANSVQFVYLRTLAEGFADCVRPPDVLPPPPVPEMPFSTPEPSAFAFLACSVLTGAVWIRRRIRLP